MFQIRSLHSTQPPSLQRIRTIARPHLEYCVPAWSPHYVKDKELIFEKIQHRFTKMFPELRKLPYLRRLEYLKLWTLEEQKNSCRFNRSLTWDNTFSQSELSIIETILTIKQWHLDQSTSSGGTVQRESGKTQTVKRDRSVCWQLMLYLIFWGWAVPSARPHPVSFR